MNTEMEIFIGNMNKMRSTGRHDKQLKETEK